MPEIAPGGPNVPSKIVSASVPADLADFIDKLAYAKNCPGKADLVRQLLGEAMRARGYDPDAVWMRPKLNWSGWLRIEKERPNKETGEPEKYWWGYEQRAYCGLSRRCVITQQSGYAAVARLYDAEGGEVVNATVCSQTHVQASWDAENLIMRTWEDTRELFPYIRAEKLNLDGVPELTPGIAAPAVTWTRDGAADHTGSFGFGRTARLSPLEDGRHRLTLTDEEGDISTFEFAKPFDKVREMRRADIVVFWKFELLKGVGVEIVEALGPQIVGRSRLTMSTVKEVELANAA